MSFSTLLPSPCYTHGGVTGAAESGCSWIYITSGADLRQKAVLCSGKKIMSSLGLDVEFCYQCKESKAETSPIMAISGGWEQAAPASP